MKTRKSLLNLMMLIAASVAVVSCSDDDGGKKTDPVATCTDGIMNGDETGVDCGGSCSACAAPVDNKLSGDITDEKTLDASIVYELDGALVIQDGGVLNIPAGTVIKASGGTAAYIAVAQGGMINVNGTATNPVVMTSAEASPDYGDWGGLVICGKAPTNKGVGVTSEVADLSYGGTDPHDNSGSIKYLRVEYTGATFSNDKEFNGVSLFSVGDGTTFDYIESYYGGDDGIEFFGGTVNGTHLVSINSGDDSIDFADGYNGTGSNWYISGGLKAGIEGSNNEATPGATNPMTDVTISNVTIVGPVTEGVLNYKEGGGKMNISNLYATNVDLGVRVSGSDTDAAARIEGGDLVMTNIQFAETEAGFLVTDYAGTTQDFVVQGITTGAGNGAAAPDWAAGWTVGLENSAVEKENLAGEITGEATLNANIEYQLTSALVVKSGGVLNIPAGTVIKAAGGTASYIAVAQGGKINVNGTAAKPVIMTSAEESPASGDWGGLVICGKAPTNKGTNVTSEVADLSYGGDQPNDNSGSITYLRVEYTGATFSNDKEFNGVSLFGVGSGTTFDYVESYFGGDDGIEFFGGTVHGTHLVSINSGDDSIDFADGFNGTGSFWYIKGGLKAGIEGSNNEAAPGATNPMTNVNLSNITIVGPVTEGVLNYKEGGGIMTIDNVYTTGVDLGIRVSATDTDAAARIEGGDLTITNIEFANPLGGFMATDYTGTTQDFYTTGSATGAGNGADAPDWAAGWTIGL